MPVWARVCFAAMGFPMEECACERGGRCAQLMSGAFFDGRCKEAECRECAHAAFAETECSCTNGLEISACRSSAVLRRQDFCEGDAEKRRGGGHGAYVCGKNGGCNVCERRNARCSLSRKAAALGTEIPRRARAQTKDTPRAGTQGSGARRVFVLKDSSVYGVDGSVSLAAL